MARQVTATKDAAKGKAPPAVQAAAKSASKTASAKAAAALPVEALVKAAAPTMVTLKHLAAGLAERHDMQKREMEAIVTDVFARLVDHLKAGERGCVTHLRVQAY